MKNTNKKFYMTKKRRAKIAQRKAIVLLVAIMLGVAVIGHAGQKEAYIAPEAKSGIVHHIKAKVANQAIKQPKIIALKSNYPEVETQVYEIADKLCKEKGLGDQCARDIAGMTWAESRFNCKVVGDGGDAYGCLQINFNYHKGITIDQARELNFAISFTLNRLIEKGYPTYRSIAIMSHNGTPGTKKTLAYLKTVNDFIK